MSITHRLNPIPRQRLAPMGIAVFIASLLWSTSGFAGAAPERFSADASNAIAPGIAALQTAITDHTVAQSARAFSVSRTGPNRIAVTGQKIVNAIYDPTQFDVQTDAQIGQVFLFPKTDLEGALFITTDQNETYALTLMPDEVPSQEIVLAPKKKPVTKEEPFSSYRKPMSTLAIEKAASFDAAIKHLLITMARDELPEGFTVTNHCGTGCLKGYSGERFAGRILLHTNTSNTSVTLTEKLFYEKGVIAVAIEKPDLKPNESTRIYIAYKRENTSTL